MMPSTFQLQIASRDASTIAASLCRCEASAAFAASAVASRSPASTRSRLSSSSCCSRSTLLADRSFIAKPQGLEDEAVRHSTQVRAASTALSLSVGKIVAPPLLHGSGGKGSARSVRVSQDCWGAMAVLRGRCWLRVGSVLPPLVQSAVHDAPRDGGNANGQAQSSSFGLNDRAFAGTSFPNLTGHAASIYCEPSTERRQCRDFVDPSPCNAQIGGHMTPAVSTFFIEHGIQ